MSNKKAFTLAMLCTLGVLLPVYLFFAALCIRSTVQPTDNAVANVPMARPMSQDAKNMLIITHKDEAYAFVILRFDALGNKICSVGLEPGSILLCDGKPISLSATVQSAGPELARMAIEETLGITVNDYLCVPTDLLIKLAQPFGSGSMRLSSYIDSEALGQLKLLVPGVENIELSPLRLGEVLASGLVPDNLLPTIRADGYLAFLRAGLYSLPDIIPSALRDNSHKLDTDIKASEIYEYERILRFLSRQEPSYKTGVLSGEYNGERYELSGDAMVQAKLYLA